MNIKVLSIQGDRVYFSSKYGDAFGRWKDNYPPKKKSYYVEFNKLRKTPASKAGVLT